MAHKSFDLSIYFVVDPSLCSGRDVVRVVRDALAGGVTMVQYRDKADDQEQIFHNAKRLQAVVRDFAEREDRPVAFLINDHVGIAQAIEADGVHIGQGDMDAAAARQTLGGDAIIGLTAFTEDQIKAVDPSIVDYIGTGPFFETKTDKGKPVLGAERFSELAQLSPVPVVGIGGITPENAAAVLKAGADGVAMMRSISAADDVFDAARRFELAVKSVKGLL